MRSPLERLRTLFSGITPADSEEELDFLLDARGMITKRMKELTNEHSGTRIQRTLEEASYMGHPGLIQDSDILDLSETVLLPLCLGLEGGHAAD